MGRTGWCRELYLSTGSCSTVSSGVVVEGGELIADGRNFIHH